LKWKKYVGLHLGSSHSLKDRILKYLRFDNTLERLWARYTGKYLPPDTYRGSHGLPISDIDLDGREEILWGSICIGQDGKTVWKITDQMPYIGHLDVVFPADIIPSIEGQEIFYAREGWLDEEGNIGVLIVNKFGETIWSKWGFTHFDGGWAAKILPNRADMQIFAYDVKSKEKSQEQGSHGFAWQGVTGYLWDSRGRHLSSPPVDWKSSTTFDWDGDGVKEIGLKKTGKILKFGKETVIQIAKGIHWGADIFGDHRDEVIVAPGDGKIYIYFNTDPLEVKPRVTKLIDRQYRNDLSRTMVNSINIPNESGIQIKN
jgi:rhamnogalacturonan endolyase